ncbi:MAG: flavin reductase [Hyphomonas sp.]|uniref:alpha/beta fold hydrolase n=1 Tax=Hyphomonas sp. TaxID=87 RepID=UPI0025C2B1BF|nr:alpha/beta fold hydrolase [Hyphomonas sp.]MBA4340293.1 flavin reductase [Hyphomonas sp.]
MSVTEFRGFAATTLRAEISGSSEDPAVLLLHGGGQTRQVWADASAALVKAGRHVINLDLRGHGESEWPTDGRYDFDAYVEDLKSVLSQLPVRPVIVAASLGGWIAAAAIGEDGGHLAAGLVLVDAPPELNADAARKVGDALRKRASTPGTTQRWDPRFLDAMDLEAATRRVTAAAPNLKLPVLFVRGALSELTKADAAGRYVSQIDGAEFAELRDAGHMAAFDRSDLFNATLLDFLERRLPRFLPDYRTGSDARTLRDALGCFATGVTVVTAMDKDGKPVGLTANSFTSVSLDPPLLLVCIAKTSSSLKAMEQAEHFGVNVLHIGQQPVSNRFARPGEDRFAETAWQRGQHDVPLLAGALVNFECVRHAEYDGGDHVILVGRVERARYEPRRDPLLYFKGKYRRLHFA